MIQVSYILAKVSPGCCGSIVFFLSHLGYQNKNNTSLMPRYNTLQSNFANAEGATISARTVFVSRAGFPLIVIRVRDIFGLLNS